MWARYPRGDKRDTVAVLQHRVLGQHPSVDEGSFYLVRIETNPLGQIEDRRAIGQGELGLWARRSHPVELRSKRQKGVEGDCDHGAEVCLFEQVSANRQATGPEALPYEPRPMRQLSCRCTPRE